MIALNQANLESTMTSILKSKYSIDHNISSGHISSSPSYLPFSLFDYKSTQRLITWSLDVENMYPSLLHSFLLRTVDYCWEKNKKILPQHPSKDCIKSMLLYSLRNISI